MLLTAARLVIAILSLLVITGNHSRCSWGVSARGREGGEGGRVVGTCEVSARGEGEGREGSAGVCGVSVRNEGGREEDHFDNGNFLYQRLAGRRHSLGCPC